MNSENYFDWAATSPADEEILKNAFAISLENYGNPSSVHGLGTQARKILEDARAKVAKVLGVKPNQIFFTSGGTESDHIPLLSLLNRAKNADGKKGKILISGIEHPALAEMCAQMKKCGFDVENLNPDKNGFVTAEEVVKKLTGDTLLVAVMAVNNETGCVQEIHKIADAITEATKGKRRPKFHVDCVQAAGKIPLNIAYSGIDSAAFSAHKISGPRGIGLLYLANPAIEPFLKGGNQESGIRSGTENLFGAVAFADCLEKYYNDGSMVRQSSPTNAIEHFEKQKVWTADFIHGLKEIKNCKIIPECRADISSGSIGSTGSDTSTGSVSEMFSPYIVQASFKGIPGQVFVRALSAKGFYISTGSACSTKKQGRPILEAMGISKDERESAVRFSFGATTTKEAMEKLLAAVKEVCADFR